MGKIKIVGDGLSFKESSRIFKTKIGPPKTITEDNFSESNSPYAKKNNQVSEWKNIRSTRVRQQKN